MFYFSGDDANVKETAIHTSDVPIKHIGMKQNIHQVTDPTLNVKSKDSKKHKIEDGKMSDPHMENGEIKGQKKPEEIMDADH